MGRLQGKRFGNELPNRKSDENVSVTKPRLKGSNLALKSSRIKALSWLGMVFMFLVFVLMMNLWMSSMKDEGNFIIIKEGKTELAPWRQEKLQKELEEIDNAEQYALLTMRSGVYPCYHCNDSKITLKAGQVWKYGVTRKQEGGRYGTNALQEAGLKYIVQFKGTYSACLKEEKRKIYFYATLPENLVREVPLIRPPGNKVDN